MNDTRFSREIGRAFSRPFSGIGLRRLLFTVIGMLIPFVGYVAQGAAWSLAVGRRDGVRGWLKLGWQILLAELFLAAPAFLAYGLILLAGARVASMAGILYLLLQLALICAAVRLIVLMPAAACCLALGAPLRVAADGKEMKRVVSGCMKQYLPACLISFVMLFMIGVLTNGMSLVPRILLGGVLAGLHTVFSAGLFMAAVRRGLGLPPVQDAPGGFVPGGFGPGARRTAALLLALTLLAGVPQRAYARFGDEDIRPVNPQDGAAGAEESRETGVRTYAEAYDDFNRMGMLNKWSSIGYDKESGHYYIWQNLDGKSSPNVQWINDGALLTADVATDFIPVVSQVKNGIQTAYYSACAYHAVDPEQKRNYTVKAAYKGATFALGGLSHLMKGASAAAGATLQQMVNRGESIDKIVDKLILIDRLDKGVQGLNKFGNYQMIYDQTNNAISGLDILRGTDYGTWTGPDGLVRIAYISHDKVKELGSDLSARIALARENWKDLTSDIGDRSKEFADSLFKPPFLRISPTSTNPWTLTPDWNLEDWALGKDPLPIPLPGAQGYGDEDPAWLLDQSTQTPAPKPTETPKSEATPAPTAAPIPGSAPAPTAAPTPDPTIILPGKAPLSVGAFMGTWVDSEGNRMILMASGDNVIVKEPDLPWYGGDVLCTEYRPEYDESSRTLCLYGLTSWVVGPELLDAAVYEDRPLEIDASLISVELTAAEVKDGVVTKLLEDSVAYARP